MEYVPGMLPSFVNSIWYNSWCLSQAFVEILLQAQVGVHSGQGEEAHQDQETGILSAFSLGILL